MIKGRYHYIKPAINASDGLFSRNDLCLLFAQQPQQLSPLLRFNAQDIDAWLDIHLKFNWCVGSRLRFMYPLTDHRIHDNVGSMICRIHLES